MKYPKIRLTQGLNPGRGFLMTLSVVLSVSLWFVIILGKDYQTILKFHCRITGIPPSVVVNNPLISNVAFNVKSRGSNLFWYWLNPSRDTILLNYNSYFAKGYILPKTHKDDFRALPQNIQILYVLPDTLKLGVFSNEWQKKVPIKPDIVLNLSPSVRMFKPIRITPDSVMVYASSSEQIASLKYCQTEPLATPELQDSSVFFLRTQSAPFKTVPDLIKVTIIPEKYTELRLDIPLTVTDIPDGTTVKLVPTNLHPKCVVPLARFEQVKNTRIEWKIPFSELNEHKPLIPDYKFLPAYIQIVPPLENEVKYIIQSEDL